MNITVLVAVLVVFAGSSAAQTLKCPPLPAGATCGHYHYHYKIWMANARALEDALSFRQFVSAEACERAKAEAAGRNDVLAEIIKTEKIDGSFQPNVYGECHCDRTDEKGRPVFVDARARLAVAQRIRESQWLIRDKFLSADKSSALETVRSLFAAESAPDRFLYQKFPVAIADDRTASAAVPLADTHIGERSQTGEVAPAAVLVDVAPPMPAAGQGGPTRAAAPAVHEQRRPPLAEPPPSPQAPAKGLAGARAFFDYEAARIAAILKASEGIQETPVRDSIRSACEERRQVLLNLSGVAAAAPQASPLNDALQRISNEADRLAFVRALFGAKAVTPWAPSDARDVLAAGLPKSSADDPVHALVSVESREARSAALYTVLARRPGLSDADRPAVLRAIESLLVTGGQQ